MLLNKAPSHLSKNIISYLEINQTEYTLIPGKLTRFLQPLDIGINMPFKSQLKNKFLISEANKLINIEEVKTINFTDNLSISNMDKLRLNLIDWTIKASFKKTTITYPLDGSMDIDFEMPEEIVNQYNKE